MTDRARLPDRRPCDHVAFEHDGIVATVTVGYRWPGFQPAEVFLHAAKAGSAVEAEARDGGIAVINRLAAWRHARTSSGTA